MSTNDNWVTGCICAIAYVGDLGLVTESSNIPPTVADEDHNQQLSNQTNYVLDQRSQNEMTSKEESQKGKIGSKEGVPPQSIDSTGVCAF